MDQTTAIILGILVIAFVAVVAWISLRKRHSQRRSNRRAVGFANDFRGRAIHCRPLPRQLFVPLSL